MSNCRPSKEFKHMTSTIPIAVLISCMVYFVGYTEYPFIEFPDNTLQTGFGK